MKLYKVEKWNMNTQEMVADYGQMCEEDMKLVTRGYKKESDPLLSEMYSRKNSNFVFMVTEL